MPQSQCTTSETPPTRADTPWMHASFLNERIKSSHNAALDDTERTAAERLLKDWQESMLIDEALFAERLAEDGLRREEFGRLLLEAKNISTTTTVLQDDGWIALVETALRDTNAAEPLPTVLAARIAKGEAVLFSGFLLPILRTAAAQLRRGLATLCKRYEAAVSPLGEKIEGQMLGTLGERLFAYASPTLVLALNVARLKGELRGDDAKTRFRYFSETYLEKEEHRRALLAEYPVLGRMLGTTVRAWLESMLEFAERFLADRERLAQAFGDHAELGPPAGVELSLSDPHCGGRSVIIATFENGRKVVYKPKSMTVDARFQALLGWLNDKGLTHPHRTITIIDRGSYGWSTFVAPAPCPDHQAVARFYWRQGSFLTLLYALMGCDVHYENLIAAGETPVLIDLESLFHNVPPDARDSALTRAQIYLFQSVYGIGLLPLITQRSKAGQIVDIGGMTGEGGVEGFSTPMPVERHLDTMHFEKREVALPERPNRATLASGEEVHPLTFFDAFLAGFRTTYDLLVAERKGFEMQVLSFADLTLRYIPRPTQRYMAFLQEGVHPDHLRDGIDRDRLLDKLWAEVVIRPSLKRLITAERADLQRGDVPAFFCKPNAPHLWDSLGHCIADYFAEPSLTRVQARLRALSEEDREEQVQLIYQAILPIDYSGARIAQPAPVHLPPTSDELGSHAYREAALIIGDFLAKHAIHGTDDVTWIGATANPRSHWEWMLAPIGPTLYDGESGVALFLGYLGALTGRDDLTSLARCAARSLLRFLQRQEESSGSDIGAFSGWTGSLYTLTHLSVLWKEPTLLDDALATVDMLEAQISQDEGIDLMIGAAGCAIVALHIHRLTGDPRLLRIAAHCGTHLEQAAIACGPGMGWRSGAAAEPLAGFSHGVSGIAWALLELAATLDEPRYRALAFQGLAYERSLYVPELNNWVDRREFENVPEDQEFKTIAWCHGGPGVALGRMLSLPHADAAEASRMRKELRIAIESTLADGFGGNHSLCHGDMGNLEIVLRAAEYMDEPTWRDVALLHATRVCAAVRQQQWRCGLPRHTEAPGLMLGVAGIGYGLLRLSAPRTVPSVLALEPPLSP